MTDWARWIIGDVESRDNILKMCMEGPRGFQKFNGTLRVEIFISLGFAEPTTQVIQACFYIR
jgi:hypothetical protein